MCDGLCCLRLDLGKFPLRGVFHGSTVIAHPPAREKLDGGWIRGRLETYGRRGASLLVKAPGVWDFR